MRQDERRIGVAALSLALWLLAPAALAAAPAAKPPATTTPAVDYAAKAEAIFATWKPAGAPGCSASVDFAGQRVLERAWGLADLEHGVRNGPATVFETGSVAKQFTAAAVLLLVRDGKLSLDDDIRRYLPELPDYGQPITVEELLNHTSGLRDWGVVAQIGGWPRTTRAYTQSDVLDIAARQRGLNNPPGTEYGYTNTGYNLLALIVERVSGQSLAGFTRTRLFVPLGMNATQWRDDFRRVVRNRAIAYSWAKDASGAWGWRQAMPFEDAYGHSGLLTTTGDLLIWNRALSGSGGLTPAFAKALQERGVLKDGRRIAYARGLVVSDYRGVTEVFHSGTTGGYHAWLGRWPSQKLSIAILCNAGDADTTVLAHRLADLWLTPGPAPKPTGVKAAALVDPARRAGLWINRRTGAPVTLVAQGDRLALKDGPALVPTGPDSLSAGTGTYVFDGSDRMRQLTADGDAIDYVRGEPALADPAQLAAYAGRYASDEAQAAYLVRSEGAGLVLRLEGRSAVSIRLSPAYRDAFLFDGGVVRFRRDAAGQVTAMSISMERVRDLTFQRAGK